MKKLILPLIALLFSSALSAQVLSSPPEKDEEFKTLVKADEIKMSAFGGPMMTFTALNGEFAHFMGGGGGLMLGGFYFGGFGLGLTTGNNLNDSNSEFGLGYGGLMTGYTMGSKKAVHTVFNLCVGWGNLGTILPEDKESSLLTNEDNITALEPSIQLEMNMARYFRVAVGAGYRFVSGVGSPAYHDYDFSGPSVSLSFKFGWFQ